MLHADCSRHFGPLFGYCDHQIQKRLLRKLRQYDVSPMQCRTLTYLCEATAEVNQRQLEKFLMVTPSTASGIVGRLEEKGFLARRASTADGRCRMLDVTQKGRTFYSTFCEIVSQVNTQLEAGFSPEESALLRSLLLRVAQNLSNKEDSE